MNRSTVFASLARKRAGLSAGRAKQSPGDREIASSPASASRELVPRKDEVDTGGFSPASLLIRQELLDHARRPRNRGALPDADIVQEEANPLCGDVVRVFAQLITHNSQLITRMTFEGHGCIISQAAASMLTEAVRGKTAEEVLRMEREDIETLLGGQLSPSRVKCGMLALIALQNGIQSLRATGGSEAISAREEIASSPLDALGAPRKDATENDAVRS